MMSSDSYISVPVLGSTRYGACILPPRLTSSARRGARRIGAAMSHRSAFRQAPGRATQARVRHIVVRVRLSARRSATVDFLVDTGATHSIVPPALARKVGAPTLPQRFEVSLADGRRRRLKACSMSVSVGGRTGPTIALLLPGSDPLLGVETLEALGRKVNPERRRLEASRAQP